jgi:hypothetical protein
MKRKEQVITVVHHTPFHRRALAIQERVRKTLGKQGEGIQSCKPYV